MASSSSSSSSPQQQQEPPWHASLHAPTHKAPLMPAHRVLTLLTLKIASLLLIDVRSTDYPGGAIRTSLNIPAQNFYWNTGILYELCYKADIEWVVFTCMSGSEGGRSARCAGWFLQHVREVAGDAQMQVLRLEGGVRGWVRGGVAFRGFMDGFRREVWE
ncbi:hypothetical protein EJ03DRAFT_303293, partial [Teratosphaeria nubilosa]